MRSKKMITLLIACIVILAVGLAACIFFIARGSSAKEGLTQPEIQQAAILEEDPADVEQEESYESEEIIAPEKMAENEIFEDVDDQIFIIADQVNLRDDPSIDSDIVDTVNQHKLIRRTGISPNWSRLNYEDQTCYVSNEFVTTEQPQLADAEEASANDLQVTGTTGKTVIIDPGHQANGDSTQEPIGPGATVTKPRVSSGTTGCVSGWDEYELNLEVSLQLRDVLISRGYTVYMTRETHEINISNKERAEFAAAHNGDILVRIHANGSADGSVHGALTMAPSDSNTFLDSDIIQKSRALSQAVISSYVAATGFTDQGIYITDEMSGINWSTMPVTIVEMGYMTNASDDAAMADPAIQVKIVKGISDGIDVYFANSSTDAGR